MTDPLPIFPFLNPLDSPRVRPPGSKSLTNRALLLAALAQGTTTLEGCLFSRDTQIMVAALRALGFTVEASESLRRITVEGRGGDIPANEATLHLGNAGTAARFLTAMLALRHGGTYHLDGDPAMRTRPMRGLLAALRDQGCKVIAEGEPDCFPFTLKTCGLRGGEVAVDASASSQILSALLLIGDCADTPLQPVLKGETVSEPFIVMTRRLIDRFRAMAGPVRTYVIEPDATAASYFLALPLAVGGSLSIDQYPYDGELQGDSEFFTLLSREGLLASTGSPPLVKAGPSRHGITADFNRFSDTFLTLAALAPLLEGPTALSGLAHTRHQECDRIAAMATELRRLGQTVEETEGSITIHPDPDALRKATRDQPVVIQTYHDHRVAMSFGVLGSHNLHGDGRPWIAIHDPACCGKTYPHFFDHLNALREGQQHVE